MVKLREAVVRYADTPTTETDVYVAAPPAAVWPLVTEIMTPSRFGTELQEAELIEPERGVCLGAQFKGRNFHPARGEWETTSTIVDFVPEHRFAWAVGDPDVPSAVWRLELAPEGDGTRLLYSAQMGPGKSFITHLIEQMPDKEERIIARRLQELETNMTATIAGIKELAEGNA
ncbi:MAG TPA: SRPBCC family protein [Acidimicrobiia bacterium]|nr:SRPBCC family protein [Acidimicrobiia bacterium]